MGKAFYLLSLGCPKNAVDSEGMGQLLRAQGYEETDRPEKADILIVNTCAFIEPARVESLTTLRKLAGQKRRHQLLIAAGCLPQLPHITLTTLVPRLDGIIGTRSWANIGAFVQELEARKEKGQRWSCCSWEEIHGEAASLVTSFARRKGLGASAYIKIADGCDAPCAFCAIPLIKGPQQSKPRENVIAEARQLVEQGVQEIILIAQDTTAYGRDWGEHDALPQLLEDILSAVPDLPWLRVMYTYPQHITPRLIQVMAEHEQICHYLDMPLQHSHPAVLQRMRRPSDTDRVRRLIEVIRKSIPDIALRTTFIVGYPGETEDEFADLLQFMREIAFDKVGVFTYSREKGTVAATLPDQVAEKVKEERYHRAMMTQQAISLEQNRKQIGHTLQVLIEGSGEGISVGRSYRDAPEIDGLVLIPQPLPVGRFISVRISEATEYDLVGDLIG